MEVKQLTINVTLIAEVIAMSFDDYQERISDFVEEYDWLRDFIVENPEYAKQHNLRQYCRLPFPAREIDIERRLVCMRLEEFNRFMVDCQSMHSVIKMCRSYVRGLTAGGSGPGITAFIGTEHYTSEVKNGKEKKICQ